MISTSSNGHIVLCSRTHGCQRDEQVGDDAHLIAVVLGGKSLEGGLNDATTETENKVKRRLLLDVVVGKSATVLELLAGEDQTLLVRRNAFLILDLGLDIVCVFCQRLSPQKILARRCAIEYSYGCACSGRGKCAYRWCPKTPPPR